MIDGRVRARTALHQLLPADHTPVPFSIVDLLARELDEYTEVIVGPGARPAGFMTHGEGPGFTERVRVCLEMLELPAAALARHQAMAKSFEHLRGFAKFEWHPTADGGVEPLAAIYFRRRPRVDAVLDRLDEWGVPAASRERVERLAATLEKDSIHFVAAAFRPGHPVHHKLYFSQWHAGDTKPATTARLGRVFELYGFDRAAIEAWRAVHDRCVADGEPTVFLSMSCSEAGTSPSFKIDYPDLQAPLASAWLPAEQRPEAAIEIQQTMAMAGSKYLTFLGVRFDPARPGPTLKYYADVPGSR